MNNGQKARQNNLQQSSDGNFGTQYTYQGGNGQTIEQLMASDFYESVKTRLSPCDTIRVMEMKDNKVVASTLMVVISRSKEPKMVLDIRPCDGSKITRYDYEETEQIPKEPIVPVIYISGSGQAEKNKNTGVWSVKCDGKVIYETESGPLAKAIARGDKPIPQN